MELIPEWAPNIHPIFVHFPIDIFLLAVLMDLLNFSTRLQKVKLRPVARFPTWGRSSNALILASRALLFGGQGLVNNTAL